MNISWQFDVAIYRANGHDKFGESKGWRFVGKSKGGAVKFDIGKGRANSKTTSRSTGAASTGKADLEVFDAYIVMPPDAPVRLDDIILIKGVKLEVISVRTNWGLHGRQGTLEVGAVASDLSEFGE